jgi:chitinase
MGRLTFVLTLFSILCVCRIGAQNAETSAANAPMVIGYYADWTAEKYPLADIPADKLTHVNYAFGKIGPDNRLTFNSAAAVERVYPGDCTGPGCPHGLFHQITLLKQKHPHLKFIMSVGGWTDSAPFYEMAATDAGRQSFS